MTGCIQDIFTLVPVEFNEMDGAAIIWGGEEGIIEITAEIAPKPALLRGVTRYL